MGMLTYRGALLEEGASKSVDLYIRWYRLSSFEMGEAALRAAYVV